MSATEAIFWTCFALAGYAYVVYPLVIYAFSKLFGQPRSPMHNASSGVPSVTVVAAAYNEASVIRDRILNALNADYPSDKLNVLIASDGSSDSTVEECRSVANPRLRVLESPSNRGKAATLNWAMEHVDSDIVLFTDANTDFQPDAIRLLVRWFTDPTIGAVCGRLVIRDPQNGKNVDGLYWRYETTIKRSEARLGEVLGANGAIYAIRRDRYVPIPDNTIVDDFVIPLWSKLRHGCKVIYDADAVAYEESPPRIRDEFHRRVRIGVGAFQSLGLLWRLLHPRHGWVAFSFLSHKIMRWFCPFFILGAFVCNVFLLDSAAYQVSFALQLVVLLLAVLGEVLPVEGNFSRVVRLFTMLASMNAALLIGFFKWLMFPQAGTWKVTTR